MGRDRLHLRLERRIVRAFVVLLGVIAASVAGAEASAPSEPIATLAAEPGLEILPLELWRDPPREVRPQTRWWWPGGSVEPERLKEQLRSIERAGFGAVEVQPLLLGLGADDLAADPRLRSVGESSFRASVASAAAAAKQIGLDFDLTLGSGWPGGLPTSKQNAERQLTMATVDLTGPARFTGPLPPSPDQSYRSAVEWVLDVLGPQDQEVRVVAVLAARLAGERDGATLLEDVRVIAKGQAGEALDWAVPDGRWRVFAFYESSTGHFVMGGAFPGAEADARVVDHLSRRGADALLEGYAAPVLAALGPAEIRDLFVDSFELMGELPFTSQFLDEFERRAGYDLTPHLPLVIRKGGESKYGEMIDFLGRYGGPIYRPSERERGERIREDYEAVRSALFQERFVQRIRDWAHARRLGLRLQAHGGYADYLDVYALADVPESEALFAAGSFDFLKLAASAAHVSGRRWASSESFITIRFFGTRLEDDEMRLLAGRAYSAGINRLVFHGVPYPYTRADGEAWYPFSGGFGRILAGPLPMSSRIDAEFLARLSDFNRFLARLSLAMSRGEPVADVAWLRADGIFPDTTSLQLGRVAAHQGESSTTRALRARGLTHDRVSRKMLAAARPSAGAFEVGAARYRALVLDPMEIAEPELLERVEAIAKAGVPVIALGELPRRAPGLRDAAARDRRVRAAAERLASRVVRVDGPEALERALASVIRPGLVEPEPGARLFVSLERRRQASGETLLLFSESWSIRRERLRMTRAGGALRIWDPWTGRTSVLRERVQVGDVVELVFDPAESLILTLEPEQP